MDKELLDYFGGDELAANVWKSKYATEGETTPSDMHMRMAVQFAITEYTYVLESRNYIDNEQIEALSDYGQDSLLLNEEELPSGELLNFLVEKYFALFDKFKYIIPQGSIMSTLGTSTIASLSNCWVEESPLDSYAGILHTDANLAFYYKRRGGVGTDLSNLRPKGTATNNTAKTTTGVVSFMPRFSNTTREVAMDGRRGALMLSIDINHPDSMDFIKSKRDGVSITGANISVRLNDEFMDAVENDEDYILRFPCDKTVDYILEKEEIPNLEYNLLTPILCEGKDVFVKRIKAKEYWNELVHSATKYAEPGIMYWDNVLKYDPAAVYKQFKPISSNPCGEQFLNANDSCRLMALNLYSFVDKPFTDKAKINYEKLYEVSYEHAKLGDNLIDLELQYIQRILDKIKSDPEPYHIKKAEYDLWEKSYKNTKAGRRIGLGITALADMLAALNIKYGSKESLEVIDRVMRTKMEAELDCTIDLAILRGTFEGYDKDLEFDLIASNELVGKNKFYNFIAENFIKQAMKMFDYGRRNVSWSTIAPTGSVSLLTQTSSGCEPLFAPYHIRRKKINSSDKNIKVDFIDESGDKWQEFPVLHEKFKMWSEIYLSEFEFFGNASRLEIMSNSADRITALEDMKSIDIEELFKKSPWYKATANDIHWKDRNKVQAILQKYTTNAISSTINLPKTTSEQEVSDIYLDGWKRGLKGQTVYVDGSRSGVLISDSSKKEDEIEYNTAPKRPKTLNCDIHVSTTKGVKLNIIVGLLKGKPYEVFILDHFMSESKMQVKRIKSGRYDLFKNNETYSEDITSEMNEFYEMTSRNISASLRHGVDIRFIVDQLNSVKNQVMTSFSRSLARVLSKYIINGVNSTLKCTECGSKDMIYEEGCNKCLNCGHSACS